MKNLKTTKIKELTILITKECNLNCSYCVQKHIKDKINDQKIKNIKNNFNKLIPFLNDFVYIDLFGGEPLLYQDALKEIISFLRQKEKELNKIFVLKIFTNNLLEINDIQFYIDNKIKFSISYDGLHNNERFPKEKLSLFKYNINILNKFNLIEKVSFSYLFNNEDNYIVKNFLSIKSELNIDPSLIIFYLIREPYYWTKEKIKKYQNDFKNFIKFNEEYYKITGKLTRYIESKLSFFDKNILSCGSGIDRFTIDSKEIIDCGVNTFQNEFFYNQKNQENNYLNFIKDNCSVCEIQNHCDKKCPKYMVTEPELFLLNICEIKKIEIKEIQKLIKRIKYGKYGK